MGVDYLMTDEDKLHLVSFLLKYLATEPLSHRKRNVIALIMGELIDEVVSSVFRKIDENGDIPF
jgi:translation initiation factor 2 beta subunit (eIF-2beta)/eIF-5